jgi:hypothetical protein
MPKLLLDPLHPPPRNRIHCKLVLLLLLHGLGIYLLHPLLRDLLGNIGNLVLVDFLDDKSDHFMS